MQYLKQIPAFIVFILLLVFAFDSSVTAQELDIIDVNTDNLPEVLLTISGRAPNGEAISAGQAVTVQHNTIPVAGQVIDTEKAASLTLFVVDLPPGVSESIPSMESTITNYAQPQYMTEGSDFVGVYQIGENNAVELLPPTQFHNGVINRMTEGLVVTEGPTRLFDSVNDLLNRVDELKPDPTMEANIILFSDGTDVLSTRITQTSLDALPDLAAERGVSIHTIWLPNSGIIQFEQVGQDNMKLIADNSGGKSLDLSNPEQIGEIYTAVQGGNDLIVSYNAPVSEVGTVPVGVSFPNMPDIGPIGTQVEIKVSQPALAIELPIEDRSFSFTQEQLDETIEIIFPTNYDPSIMEISGNPEIVVNNKAIAVITPLSNLSEFKVGANLNYGVNTVHIQYQNADGAELRTAPIQLTVINAVETDGTGTGAADGGDGNANGNSGAVDSGTGSETEGSGDSWFSRIFKWFVISLLILLLLAGLWYLYQWYMKREKDRPRKVTDEPFEQYPSQTDGHRRKARKEEAKMRKDAEINNVRQAPVVMRDARPSTSSEFAAPESEPVIEEAATPAAESRTRVNASPGQDRTTQLSAPTGKTAMIEVIDSTSTVSSPVMINRPEFLIGRSPTVDFSFPDDPTVSRIHATIVRDGEIFRIYDEQSTSGTYINDREVPEYGLQLADGDEIHLGAVHLRFKQEK